MTQKKKGPLSIFRDDMEASIDAELVERPHPILLEVERYSTNKNFPILSPSSGKILGFLTQQKNPRRILELGTGLGYSASWMLFHSSADAKIDTVERDPDNSDYAKELWTKVGLIDRIRIISQDCISYLKSKKSLEYDFVFIDSDKVGYPEILALLLERLAPKSWIVLDNMIWKGRIFDANRQSPSDLAVRKAWQIIHSRSLSYTLFPAGDGLVLIQI